MLVTWDITNEDEAALLKSISKHSELAREYNHSACENRKVEIMGLIEQLRVERQEIVNKYEKAEGTA